MNRYESVESAPLHRGKKELLDHLSGIQLTASRAIIAKCYECNGYYVDGAEDCRMPDCPLYLFNPYGKGTRKKRKVSPKTIEALKKANKKER